MACGDPSRQHCRVLVANEQVNDGLARLLVDMHGDYLGLAVLRSAAWCIAVLGWCDNDPDVIARVQRRARAPGPM